MKLDTAKRQKIKLKIGISGASGFGKTYSALLLAHGICDDFSKIAVIDTENESAGLYSHLGSYKVLNLQPPYSPERYIEAINLCENAGIEVIIIDSISHEWSGKGGCLELHEQLGGRFQDWAKISPRHQAFIDAILQTNCHVITTARRKMDYSMDIDSNGRTKVTKHGTKEITREGFEYELTVNFELINDNHLAKASKDRTGLFMNKPEFIINKATGNKLKAWCSMPNNLDEVRKQIDCCTTVDGLRHVYDKYPTLQKSIYNDIVERKQQLESIVDPTVIEENHQNE